ncbi:MAG: hypothetical protein PHR77_17115, partial [Kiritimatiellae bacterium]|nr:hypothetical protein [Kiritimatiellia bacterium]
GPEKRYVDFAMPARLGFCRCIRIRGRIRNDAGAQKTLAGLSAKCHLLPIPPTNMIYSRHSR